MIKINNFIKNVEESDSRHICYNLNTSIRIFNHLLEDEDLEEVYIYVANDIQLVSIINHIVNYIDWFATCETVLKTYYENKLGEEVYDAWFNDIEVYRVDITFNNEYDYGATVYCGDRIYLDHALEINFDKNNILDIGLNG